MEVTNIQDAQAQLSTLIERALEGEDIVIARAGTPVARLVPFRQDEASEQRRGGQWKGQVRIAEDFDDLPEDIARAFGMEPE